VSAVSVDWRRLALIVATGLALSVVFFAPRLWLMQHYVPGSFQWDRGHTFLLQCEAPLRRDVEPAMYWRLLPPAVAHILGLRGHAPFLLSWLGVIASTAYIAVLLRRRLDDWRYVAGGIVLFATTSAVLVPVGWLGINDGWIWLGLLAVAFGRSRWALPVACLLAPWIDERFVIGFPLAWLVRHAERGEIPSWRSVLLAAWLVPYAALRVAWLAHDPIASRVGHGIFSDAPAVALAVLPFAPLGWWMGLRAGWAAIAYAIASFPGLWRGALPLVALATAGVMLAFAGDVSRSIAILTPLLLLGCFRFARAHPAHAPRVLLALGFANLLIPALHVVAPHYDPIDSLPVELIRLLRH